MSTFRIYTKQALSIPNQIALLKNRGLQIDDESLASKFLSEVSYFRLVQYLRPMEADKITHKFKPNSRFEDAIALYEFDNELRNLIFRAIQKLEIALRTKIIHEFSIAHGPFWFFDTNLADDEHKFIENMNAIDREILRSKNEFIKKHLVDFNRNEIDDYFSIFFDFKYALEDLLKRDIDLVESQSLKNPYFINSVNNTKTLVYGG